MTLCHHNSGPNCVLCLRESGQPLRPPPGTVPYQPHSATSKAAAREIGAAAGTFRAKVLWCLSNAVDGRTDEEIQRLLKMDPSTERPRRIELTQTMPPLVVDSGRKRRTRSGRMATVWVAR